MVFFYLMFLNIYYWEKRLLKTFWKENLKKCTSFEEQKGTSYIWENVYFGIIIFSCVSFTKPSLRFLLNFFIREIKGFHQSSLANEVDFRDIMNISPNILAKNWKQGFVDERALIIKTLISSCLRKKRPENAFLTLIVNYRKFVQENKLCPSKQR